MTKRFELKINFLNKQTGIVDWVKSEQKDAICVFNNLGTLPFSSAPSVCNLLNQLNDENEQLKGERDYFERKKCEYFNKYNKKHLDNIQLRKENEQLKQKLKEDEGGKGQSNSISQLKKKNELKEAINRIDSLIHTQEDYLAWSIIYETLTNGKPLSYRLKM